MERSGDADLDLLQSLGLLTHAAERAERRGLPALSARLWNRAGLPERAIAALVPELRRSPNAKLLDEAAQLAVRVPDRALSESVIAALDAVDPKRSAEVRRRLDAILTPSWSADLSRPLASSIELRVAAAVRHDLTAAELHVDVPSGIGAILRVPMRTTGDPVWLHIAGEWTRAEWGSTLVIAARPVDAPMWTGVESWCRGEGAGGVLFRACTDLQGVGREPDAEAPRKTEYHRVVSPSVDEVTPFDLRLGGTAAHWGAATWGTRGGAPVREFMTVHPPAAGESWELVVAGENHWGAPPGQLASAVLRRLEVGGLVAESAVSPKLAPALAWATRGMSWDTSAPELDPVLVGLVRLDASLLDRAARDWGDAARARLFSAAWSTAALNAPGDRQVVDALLAAPPLVGLEPDESLALQVARAQTQLRVGRVEEGRTALTQAWFSGAGSGLRGWRARMEAAALLAEVALADGDEAGAQAWAGRAASVAPDPDLGSRLLRSRSRLADRVGRVGWEVLGE